MAILGFRWQIQNVLAWICFDVRHLSGEGASGLKQTWGYGASNSQELVWLDDWNSQLWLKKLVVCLLCKYFIQALMPILGYIQIMKQKKLRSPAMLKREDAGGGVEGRWYGDHLGKRSGCCLEKGRGWMEVSWVFNEKKWIERWALSYFLWAGIL